MMTVTDFSTYRATTDQWMIHEMYANGRIEAGMIANLNELKDPDSCCLLELRARIQALEGESWKADESIASCVNALVSRLDELTARLKALEAAQHAHIGNPPPGSSVNMELLETSPGFVVAADLPGRLEDSLKDPRRSRRRRFAMIARTVLPSGDSVCEAICEEGRAWRCRTDRCAWDEIPALPEVQA